MASSVPSTSWQSPSSAPPGTTNTMEKAGAAILKEYCKDYNTTTTASYLLPPVVDSEYTEERTPGSNTIPKPQHLTPTEEDKYRGILTNQGGEMAEYHLFSLFHQLSNTIQSNQFIVLKNLDIDCNNDNSIKENQLRKELPTIDLSSVNMRGEHDFVLIMKNVGIILFEVKTSSADKNISSAEKQLENGTLLMQALMGGVKGTGTSLIPVEKVIFLPNETTPSPPAMTIHNSHQIHQDQLQTFDTKFSSIVQHLKTLSNNTSLFTPEDFEKFTNILIGFWCLKPMRPGISFNTKLASAVEGTKEVDRKVAEQEISSFHVQSQTKKGKRKYKRPVTDVEYCSPDKIPRTCTDIGVLFLTPQQKDILDNYPCALITGGAGTGKTLLMLFKTISIIQNDTNAKVILAVPSPHDLRCEKILRANKIAATKIKKFPPDEITLSSVFIIQLNRFFQVTKSELLAYDLEKFHLFMDDVQSLIANILENGKIVTYDDIYVWIDHHYNTALKYDKHFWCCVDVLQGRFLEVGKAYSTTRLLFNSTGARRCCNIPTKELTKILRNSSDIIPTVMKMREERINNGIRDKMLLPNMQFGMVSSGHHITGAPVLYHKLRKGTDGKHMDAFLLQRVEEELTILLKGHPSFKPCDIAILHQRDVFNIKLIKTLLNQKFCIGTQTIRESIVKSSDNNVVLDNYEKAMSYETTNVIVVWSEGETNTLAYRAYLLASRARARLTIIDDCVRSAPLAITEHVTLVTWEEQNGAFVRD